MDTKLPKSWARETAFIMFLFLGVLAWRGDRLEELKVLVYPASVFGMLAYGYKNSEHIAMAIGNPTK